MHIYNVWISTLIGLIGFAVGFKKYFFVFIRLFQTSLRKVGTNFNTAWRRLYREIAEKICNKIPETYS